MSELLLCAACLNNEVDLIHIDTGQLRDQFNAICKVKTEEVTGVSQYLCIMCVAFLKKMMRLRELCLTSAQAFQEIKHTCHVENRRSTIEDLNPYNISPMLSFPKFNRFAYSEVTHGDLDNEDKSIIDSSSHDVATLSYDINENEDTSQTESKKIIITEDIKVNFESQQDGMDDILNENYNNDDTYDNQNDMFDNYDDNQDDSQGFVDTKPNQDETINNTQATGILNNQYKSFEDENEKVLADSLEFPPEVTESYTLCEKLKIVEYYAKLEWLPDIEAKAAHELTQHLKSKEKSARKRKSKQCDKCQELVCYKLMKGHLDAHEQINEFHCSICFVNYKSKHVFNLHRVSFHMFKYICRICSEVSFTLHEATNHYKHQHNADELEYCNKVEEIKALLKKPAGMDPHRFSFTKTPVQPEDYEKVFQKRKLEQSYIDAIYKCGICFRVQESHEALKKHALLLHTPKSDCNFKCKICTMYFDKAIILMDHNKREHHYQFSCKLCNHVAYNRGDAIKHKYEVHSKENSKTCNKCKAEFPSRHALDKHMATHSHQFCNYCGLTFLSQQAVWIHVSMIHDNQAFIACRKAKYDPDRTTNLFCRECDVQFLNAPGFNRHLKIKEHTATTAIECNNEEGEGQSDTTNRTLKQIRPNQRKFKPMNCHLCGKWLELRTQIYKHYKEVHTLSDLHNHIYTEILKCDQCEYTTKIPKVLRHHVRERHNNGFSAPCSTCGKRFKSVTNLRDHEARHTDEFRFPCSKCDKKFKTNTSLYTHFRNIHLKIPNMSWIRRAERKKQERALLRQQRELEIQGKEKKTSKPRETEIIKFEEVEEMDIDKLNEEQYFAAEYLKNFVRSGNVVFGTNSRY